MASMVEVSSPITGKKNVTLIETFPVEKIIKEYKKLDINVDNYFIGLDTVFLYECNDTKYKFYYPSTIFGDSKFYSQLQEKIRSYYSESRWEHGYCAKLISPNETILEVGAGSGFFLEKLKEKGVNTTGLELNQKAIETAKGKGIVIYNQLIEEHVYGNEKKYDIVCSFQVLEHIYDVKNYIDSCLKVLKTGGKLIIGVPNNNPFIYRYDKWHLLNLPPHHAGLWNKTAFEKIQNYFNISLMESVIEPLKEHKEWYLVQKNHFKKVKPIISAFMNLIPRPVYKTVLKLFSRFIDGRNIVVVFTKKAS